MKKIGLIWVGMVLTSTASASNYPADYCHQVVRVQHHDAVLFASAGSGCQEGAIVLGYKNSGYLAQFGAHALTAVITSSCRSHDGSMDTRQTQLELGREWHGTGYLSRDLSIYNLIPRNCADYGYPAVYVAFTDNQGHWDSRYGQNYQLSMDGFRSAVSHKTNESSYGGLTLSAWDFVVNEMRK